MNAVGGVHSGSAVYIPPTQHFRISGRCSCVNLFRTPSYTSDMADVSSLLEQLLCSQQRKFTETCSPLQSRKVSLDELIECTM